jgi:rhodanese-related sulfurtransferase
MKNKNFTFNSNKAKEFFLEKISFEISPRELEMHIKSNIEDINIVDVRSYDDYIDGHIPFAIHVPIDNLEEHLVMFDKDKVNIVYSYCPYCKMADKAAYIIADNNYPVMKLCGGYKIWHEIGFDTIKTSSSN